MELSFSEGMKLYLASSIKCWYFRAAKFNGLSLVPARSGLGHMLAADCCLSCLLQSIVLTAGGKIIISKNNISICLSLSCPKSPVRLQVLSTACDIISFYGQGQLCPLTCACESFKPYQNEHNSDKDTREKGKKPCNIDLKISMKILFQYPPTFPFI